MPTMLDIAKRAGVSKSTVSYVLSGKRSISEAVKQRVFAAMAELGYYQPDALGRSLATRRSRMIALVLPRFTAEQAGPQIDLLTSAEFMLGASQAATHRGYGLLVWTAPEDEKDLLRLVQQVAVDGLILLDVRLQDARIAQMRDHAIPFSIIGHGEQNDDLNFIDFDFEQAVHTCIQYLADLGHRSVCFVVQDAPANMQPAYTIRSLRAFRQAIERHELAGFVLECAPNAQEGYQTIDAALAKEPDLHAAIVLNPWLISTLLQVAAARDLKIPADFSVVAITSPHLVAITTPRLTAVGVPYEEMGRLGVEALICQLEGETKVTQQILQADLIPGQSSGKPDSTHARPR